jgi:hypothetical protein
MPTITITDEELHEIVEVLNYRVMAYRNAPPLSGKKKLSPEAVAWIDRYEARTNVTIKKLEGILNDPANSCDPYHLKQIASWNKKKGLFWRFGHAMKRCKRLVIESCVKKNEWE